MILLFCLRFHCDVNKAKQVSKRPLEKLNKAQPFLMSGSDEKKNDLSKGANPLGDFFTLVALKCNFSIYRPVSLNLKFLLFLSFVYKRLPFRHGPIVQNVNKIPKAASLCCLEYRGHL